jgi:hypothetical protein
MSSLETNLRGRLRNTKLPSSHGLLPLFEAVVNSIHSIEDANLLPCDGRIEVSVLRTEEQRIPDIDIQDPSAIVGFTISDNGIGFNEDNMSSFKTLDSEHKIDRGGRGVGRLLWLKAFKNVTVSSLFDDINGHRQICSFSFDSAHGVISNNNTETAEMHSEKQTIVHLNNFAQRYRQATRKTVAAIANSLLEHCLWYFVRQDGAPTIVVKDEETSIELNQLYKDYMISSATKETVSIKNSQFELTHIKLRASSNRVHSIGLCASNRLVKEEKLSGKIPGLYGKLHDGESDFVYVCYVGSEFLDESVASERTDFDIAESSEPLFTNQEISLSDIRNAVIESASIFLDRYLNENKRLSEVRITGFISQQAPRYRPILSRMQVDQVVVNPSISNKELELVLHKELSNIEAQMLTDGHDLMKPKIEDNFEDYNKRLKGYLKTADEIKKSDLANYVFHRKVTLDLLDRAIQRTDDGKYSREDLIHTLLMPMQVDSNEVLPLDCNLWVIDERLTFHNYLASDKPLSSMPITGSNETREPDIIALNVFDNPLLVSEGERLPMASIVVVEIKRPMRNDAKQGEDKDPIEQALGYLDRIRVGEVKTSLGRPIPRSEDIPGFCYVLCDITPSIEKRCRMHDATRTSDGLGYFFYHKEFSAYVEILSFDRLVNSARERNRAFFDQLGLPTT